MWMDDGWMDALIMVFSVTYYLEMHIVITPDC